ncbi:hypothetical protein [Leucobacter soli]|uniref:hypothetical protein n=1 Tax=Leucobacter soli TaxID=2812850 RepID=UPI0036188913
MLTSDGAATHALSRGLYAEAVRELILTGLGSLPGDGVDQLADLARAILTSLDTARAQGDGSGTTPTPEGPSGTRDCAADPAPACPAAPTVPGSSAR